MIEVRPAALADLDAILAAEAVLFPTQAWSRATYAEELTRADRRYFAVDDVSSGELAGYAGLALDPLWSVMTIGTLPPYQRRGIARALLAELIGTARAEGGGELFLEVNAKSSGAQALYREAGFERVGLRKRYYWPEGDDAVVMRLDLDLDET